MTTEIAAPKPDPGAKAKNNDFKALFKRNFERKITSAKIEKICWQVTIAALMQPLHYELRCPAAEDNPEHPLLITINRENFILLWGFEINRKYIDFRAEKSMEKTGFQRSKSIENLCIFHFFLFCPLLLMFLLISKVRLWCETSMPRTFCKGVWADHFARSGIIIVHDVECWRLSGVRKHWSKWFVGTSTIWFSGNWCVRVCVCVCVRRFNLESLPSCRINGNEEVARQSFVDRWARDAKAWEFILARFSHVIPRFWPVGLNADNTDDKFQTYTQASWDHLVFNKGF